MDYIPPNQDSIDAIEMRIKGIRQANQTAYNRKDSGDKSNPDADTIRRLSSEYMNAIEDLNAEKFKSIQYAIDEAYELLKSGQDTKQALRIMKWISNASKSFSEHPAKVKYT